MNIFFLILITTTILNTIPTFASEQRASNPTPQKATQLADLIQLKTRTMKPLPGHRTIFGEKRTSDEKAQEMRNKIAGELCSEFFAITGRKTPFATNGQITVEDLQKIYSNLEQARRDAFLFKKPAPKIPTFVRLRVVRAMEYGKSQKVRQTHRVTPV